MPDQRRPARRVLDWLGGRRPPTPPSDHIPVTSATDGREHKVRTSSYAHAMSVGTGEAIAMCGHAVILCSLATPPGPPCPRCAEHTG